MLGIFPRSRLLYGSFQPWLTNQSLMLFGIGCGLCFQVPSKSSDGLLFERARAAQWSTGKWFSDWGSV
ncbi:MAG TPA: hypothetical protein VKP30_27400, partial [Polyangiaceae bacterium]|nr:hypothetical protein [Polyangiaceae bacterium]